jgi:hypothetical protein
MHGGEGGRGGRGGDPASLAPPSATYVYLYVCLQTYLFWGKKGGRGGWGGGECHQQSISLTLSIHILFPDRHGLPAFPEGPLRGPFEA